ncbi:CobW family GTP-binding protein [Bacillus massiliigorillae]|uniref:CobW family GTP-binding protein n=1 Tax=Bacillus massiliigorillae TaxID=1243664 RepID=UPI0003A9FDBF|nr:GTP-binding protein [Bacillus massiliigorillae]
MSKTEVYIIGGFLGSGKTTLLQQIMKQEKEAGRQIAVLLNELGSISIDSALIEEEGVPFKELFDGCICCTISEKLEGQLQSLLYENNLDAIYIETTGAAHPVEVVDSIMSPILVDQLEYRGIVTVVDISRWRDREQFTPQIRQLMIEQLVHADTILLNKVDLVSEAESAQILFEIQSLNSEALCLFTNHSKVSLKDFQGRKAREQQGHNTSKHDIAHLQLQTIVYTFNKSIPYESFENWLRALPDTVYRIKGYIGFTHSQYPYLFQYSYGTPVMIPEIMKMPLNIVIIGQNLNKDEIVQQLDNL